MAARESANSPCSIRASTFSKNRRNQSQINLYSQSKQQHKPRKCKQDAIISASSGVGLVIRESGTRPDGLIFKEVARIARFPNCPAKSCLYRRQIVSIENSTIT